MCRFCDRDAQNIRRCEVDPGPGPTEMCYWNGQPAMPKPGKTGQEWVYVRDEALLRKWRRKLQRNKPTSAEGQPRGEVDGVRDVTKQTSHTDPAKQGGGASKRRKKAARRRRAQKRQQVDDDDEGFHVYGELPDGVNDGRYIYYDGGWVNLS
ncbi:hypothetical protein QJQ45_003518 [Haematococcus lacustris]|nr:hypothetical protein QJQ45_003518 [Haematococcus lacustris]